MKAEELFDVDADCADKCVKDASQLLDSLDRGCCLEEEDDMQDLYSSRTTYGLHSSRPTMINPKYRQKEERRKVLKLSMNKLKSIEDPESSLRRSVLINNTVKRLQREAKEEKLQKNQIMASSVTTKCFGLSNDFIVRQEENLKTADMFTSCLTAVSRAATDQLLDITNLPDGKGLTVVSNSTSSIICSTPSLTITSSQIMTPSCGHKFASDCLECHEAMLQLALSGDRGFCKTAALTLPGLGRKRTIDESLDEDEECDVLSHFYLPPPPTPRTFGPAAASPLCGEHSDEDEDVNVVDVDTPPSGPPAAKRKRCEFGAAGGDQSGDAGHGCVAGHHADAFDSAHCLTVTAADRLRDNLSTIAQFDDWMVDEGGLLSGATTTASSACSAAAASASAAATSASPFANSTSASMCFSSMTTPVTTTTVAATSCPTATTAVLPAAAAPSSPPSPATSLSCSTAASMSMSLSMAAASTSPSPPPTAPSPTFSCGHSSMLSEIVFQYNLIASLES